MLDPCSFDEAAAVVGQPEVKKFDDGLEPCVLARVERPIPQGPVVRAGPRFCEPPRRAVADDMNAEVSDRSKIVIHVLVMPGCCELILAVPLTLAHDDRVGPFFTDRPNEIGKSSVLFHGRRLGQCAPGPHRCRSTGQWLRRSPKPATARRPARWAMRSSSLAPMAGVSSDDDFGHVGYILEDLASLGRLRAISDGPSAEAWAVLECGCQTTLKSSHDWRTTCPFFTQLPPRWRIQITLPRLALDGWAIGCGRSAPCL